MITRIFCFNMSSSLLRRRKTICLILRILLFSVAIYVVRDFYNFYSNNPVLPNDEQDESFPEEQINELLFLPTLKIPEVPKHISDDRTGENITTLTEEEFFDKVRSQNGGVTKDPIDFKSVDICIEKSKCLPYEIYVKWRADNLARVVNHHLEPDRVPPTLKPYPEDMQRPDPMIMVKDKSMTIDEELVKRQLKKEKERRISLGDDDLLKFIEIKRAMRMEKGTKVPNIVHFIWFGCRIFKIHHYVSMLSALRYQKPELILFHTNCVPNGTYWDSIEHAAGNTLMVIRRSPPQEIFGKSFLNVEHQSDVARLQILLEVGGIYMDDDLYILKSLDELRVHDMVLGEENYDALANSVILASKDSWFLRRWYHEYQNFNASRWSDSSCFVPWALWRFFPVTVTVIKEKMLRPNWEEIDYTYLELWDWSKSFTIHLFSRYMVSVDGVEERSMEEIAVLNTTYGEVTRHVIWGDYHIRNPVQILFDVV